MYVVDRSQIVMAQMSKFGNQIRCSDMGWMNGGKVADSELGGSFIRRCWDILPLIFGSFAPNLAQPQPSAPPQALT
jgi:hypothetical protein